MARRISTVAVLTLLAVSAARTQSTGVPVFEVDAAWPKGLPNNWTFGEFSDVAGEMSRSDRSDRSPFL